MDNKRIKEIEELYVRDDGTTHNQHISTLLARIRRLVDGIERHRAMNMKILHSVWDDELYKLIEKEKP